MVQVKNAVKMQLTEGGSIGWRSENLSWLRGVYTVPDEEDDEASISSTVNESRTRTYYCAMDSIFSQCDATSHLTWVVSGQQRQTHCSHTTKMSRTCADLAEFIGKIYLCSTAFMCITPQVSRITLALVKTYSSSSLTG
ncbi:hypothetical protein KC367_g20 [Hortaea werneckii]|nr:hypothetical protein KC367_g20 [Hortaea werneckii]